MVQGFQNPDLDFDALQQQAVEAMPEHKTLGENFLQYLRNKYPGQFDGAYFEQAKIKGSDGLDRVLDKIEYDYGGDHTQLTDLVRGRIIVEVPEQIEILQRELASPDVQQQLGIRDVKDSFSKPLPTHFRSINTRVELPNGHVAEFRIDQTDMAIAGDQTHKLYEEMQDIQRAAAKRGEFFNHDEEIRHHQLLEEQRAIFNNAAEKANLDGLLNEKGVAVLEVDRQSRATSLAETFNDAGKYGGIITGVVMTPLVAAFTYAATGDGAQAAEAGLDTLTPYGETDELVNTGQFEAAQRSATIETGGNIGGAGGALGGAAIGTAIAPGVGTLIGGVVGALGGGIGSGYLTAKIYDNYEAIKANFVEVSDDAMETLNAGVDSVKSLFGWGNDAPGITLEQARAALPDQASDGMSPEIESLVEVKASDVLFEQQFENLKDQGSIGVVERYIQDMPPANEPEFKPQPEYEAPQVVNAPVPKS